MQGPKPTVALAALSLMLVGFTTAVATDAAAHYCKSSEPSNGCGDCKDTSNGTDPYHKHLYNDGSLYCESGPCCDKTQVAIETNLLESLP